MADRLARTPFRGVVGAWGSALPVLTLSNIGCAAANSGGAVLATALLDAHERGKMVLGVTLSSMVALGCCLGSGSYFRSTLPGLRGDSRRNLTLAFAALTMVLAVLAAATSAILCYVLGGIAATGMRSPGFVAAVASFAAALTLSQQANDRWFANGRFLPAALWSGASGVVTLLAAVLSLSLWRSSASILALQALGVLLLVGCQAAPRLHALATLRSGAAFASAIRLVTGGFGAMGLNLGLAIALRSDRYAIGAFVGTSAVAVYALAATLSEVPKLLTLALGQIFFQQTAEKSGGISAGRAVLNAILLTLVSGGPVAVVGWFAIGPVFGSEFLAARPLLLVLLIAEICMSPYVVLSRGILGKGWTKIAGKIGVIFSVAAVAVYVIAVRLADEFGAAVASVLIYGALSVTCWQVFRVGDVTRFDGARDERLPSALGR